MKEIKYNQKTTLKVTLTFWFAIGCVLVAFMNITNTRFNNLINNSYIPGGEFYFLMSGGSDAILILLLYLYLSLPIVSLLVTKHYIDNKRIVSREMVYISVFWVMFWVVFASYPELFLMDSGTRMGRLFVGLIRLSDVSACLTMYIVFFAGVYGLSSIATAALNRYGAQSNKV